MTASLEMKMSAITSTGNDALNKALIRLDWTQSDLARRSKINISIISDIMNLRKPPTEQEANAIQRALGEAGEYLDVLEHWSATFAMPNCGHEEQPCLKVRFESLWSHAEAMQLAVPECENEGLEEAMETVLSGLAKKTYEVLKQRFWKGESRTRIGDVLGVTHERVRQIEAHAFRTLRRPTWFKKLGPYTPRHLKPKPSLYPRRRKHLLKNYDASRRQKKGTDIVIGDES
jgi:DNA-directed RNA polymerase sigma subunit (sigma70/sigma32)